ncbi:MAG: exodeoxyribonuclease VII large subunit [Nitrospira sp.]|nr:exodeoxyribonuclease VII large subunit [bacterium]MBL7048795.1 exodeoxyribonuclease VII large subunit [Nitrospira sp.]
MMNKTLTLFELNQLIRTVLESSLGNTFLVTAEIASCNVKNHCYLSLVDKDGDSITAEAGAVIWAGKYRGIASRFKKATGMDLKKGIKILFEAEISFHERYGLKLNISDIDPSYTVGEMAVKRKEILERLGREGLLELNRQLAFPAVPQRIGIISSATAAGYEDFMNHLLHNPYGYVFESRLYEAAMQGDNAESTIVKALDRCRADATSLDLVVIVRGGGGQTDLSCFDNYEIGRAIAMMPLPVLSGIGHHRDITVTDEVSNMQAKTPTGAADILINRIREYEDRLDALAGAMVSGAGRLTTIMQSGLASLVRRLELSVRGIISDNRHKLEALQKGVQYSRKFIKNEQERLAAREGHIALLNPLNIMKRGYSITYSSRGIVRSADDAAIGDSLRTILLDGELLQTVDKIKMKKGKK